MIELVGSGAEGGGYAYFENRECEFYPCHGVEHINCLFCYCPLYHDEGCGGDWADLNGAKDCSACTYPHVRENYYSVIARLSGKHGR
ncbi:MULTISPECIES: cysteine-rich small domain-containing protein [unclassified Adlercreutzia]|uniref:cysteine-rich small domain-containing protein n=1 Tax=unclassified Adlercreutzia TaxID=2636013 RepID=UPI00197F9D02|nr:MULTISPECIES: cysteine-rich small domain-containing protein [unclassified Adlercreutzia]